MEECGRDVGNRALHNYDLRNEKMQSISSNQKKKYITSGNNACCGRYMTTHLGFASERAFEFQLNKKCWHWRKTPPYDIHDIQCSQIESQVKSDLFCCSQPHAVSVHVQEIRQCGCIGIVDGAVCCRCRLDGSLTRVIIRHCVFQRPGQDARHILWLERCATWVTSITEHA